MGLLIIQLDEIANTMFISQLVAVVDRICERVEARFLNKTNIQKIHGLQSWFSEVDCEIRVPTKMTYVMMASQIIILIFYIAIPFSVPMRMLQIGNGSTKNQGEAVMVAIFLGIPATIFYFLLTYKKIATSIVKAYRRTRRFAQNPKPAFLDSRRPVLLLRSFHADNEDNFLRSDQRTPEELLVEALGGVGPVITAGEPGQQGLPLLGATRIYLDQEWDRNILKLIKASGLVVIDAGNSACLRWEMECVKNIVNPRRVLVSLLNRRNSIDHKTEMLEANHSYSLLYSGFVSTFQQAFGNPLPKFDSDTFMIAFDGDWSPYPIKYDSRNRPNSSGALSHFLSGLNI